MAYEERMKILQLLEEQKITAADAERLLSNLDNLSNQSIKEERLVKRDRTKKFLRIEVNDNDDQVKVNVPLSLVKAAMSFIPKEAKVQLDNANINIEDIIKLVEEGADGQLVDVQTKDGTTVAIYID